MSTATTHIKTEKRHVPALRFMEFDGDWNKKKIREVLTIGSGKDYKHLKPGNIPVYGTGGLMAKVDTPIHTGKTVFIGRKGSIDKPFYYDGDFWTVDTLFYTHSFQETDPYFVYGLFQKINWYKHNEASGVPSLSKTTIGSLVVNLPTLPEQQKIASFLSAVDEKIQQLTKKKALLELYKKGVMQQLFSGKLRFKPNVIARTQDEAISPKETEYPDWEEKRLGEIGKIITGSTPPTSNSDFYDGQFLFVSPADINESRYIFNTNTTLTELGFGKGREIAKGAVLFVCIGSTIGKVAQAGKDCITNQQINAIVASKEYSNEFVYSLLELFGSRIKLLAGVQAVPLINKTEFSKLKYKFPSLEEQQKIARYLSSIDTKIESVNNQITQTQTFKKGLLQQMFV